MADGKHTPGPYTTNFHHTRQMGGRTYAMIMGPRDIVPIAAVTLGVEGMSHAEGRANASLFGAAPDMLAWVKHLENILVYQIGVCDNPREAAEKRTLLLRVQATIAKAERT